MNEVSNTRNSARDISPIMNIKYTLARLINLVLRPIATHDYSVFTSFLTHFFLVFLKTYLEYPVLCAVLFLCGRKNFKNGNVNTNGKQEKLVSKANFIFAFSFGLGTRN